MVFSNIERYSNSIAVFSYVFIIRLSIIHGLYPVLTAICFISLSSSAKLEKLSDGSI